MQHDLEELEQDHRRLKLELEDTRRELEQSEYEKKQALNDADVARKASERLASDLELEREVRKSESEGRKRQVELLSKEVERLKKEVFVKQTRPKKIRPAARHTALVDQLTPVSCDARVTLTADHLKTLSRVGKAMPLSEGRQKRLLDENLFVESSEGSATFFGTNLEAGAIIELAGDANRYGSGMFLLRRRAIEKMLKSKRDLFDLVVDDGALAVSAYREAAEPMHFRFPVDDIDDFPSMPRGVDATVPVPGLLPVVEAVRWAAALDGGRYAMNCVFLDFLGDSVVATDGKRMTRWSVDFSRAQKDLGSNMLMAASFKSLVGVATEKTEAIGRHTDGAELSILEFEVPSGRVKLIERIPDGEFPPWRDVLVSYQKDDDVVVLELDEFAKERLKEILDAAASGRDSLALVMDLDPEGREVMFSSRDPSEGDMRAVLDKPLFQRGKKPVEIGFNPSLIRKLLGHEGLERLFVKDARSAALWAGRDFDYILMPIQIV